ncbi:hypothetical protein T10_1749 [Trichinella papuae]|uniref:Uncharacterized protein n=1 Tax=Trichinella papuae TaxID=268474 RepID=A0A0V1N986_9BILA|nr:hypothetical protein T10_1749 [Trichinella papuae]
MSTRRRDRVSEKEPARSDGERTRADPEETNQRTPPGGSLHYCSHYNPILIQHLRQYLHRYAFMQGATKFVVIL